MKRLLILVCAVLLCATTASAQYAVATVSGVEGNVVRVDFTGSGVERISLTYVVSSGTTGSTFRNWRDEQIAALNTISTFISSAKLTPGAVIPAGPGPTAPTAKEVWQAKARRLVVMQDIKAASVANTGSPNAAFVSELNALAADVATSFAAGFSN